MYSAYGPGNRDTQSRTHKNPQIRGQIIGLNSLKILVFNGTPKSQTPPWGGGVSRRIKELREKVKELRKSAFFKGISLNVM